MAKGLEGLQDALENPEPLLKRWGALMVAASHEAFRLQRWGRTPWPARYGGSMPPPFINIMGALKDFQSGRDAPRQVQFQERPALIDEGMRGGLMGSINYITKVSGTETTVEVGTNKEYAALHFFGGKQSITLTGAAKERVKAWLFKSKQDKNKFDKLGRPTRKYQTKEGELQAKRHTFFEITRKDGWRERVTSKKKAEAALEQGHAVEMFDDRSGYKSKLWPPKHTVEVAPRPFMGIHDDLERDMITAGVEYFKKRLGGDSGGA